MLKKKKLYMFSLNKFTSFAVSKWARTVAVVAEKNRVLLRVSFRSIVCTTGVIEALMVTFLRKARDV